MKGFVLCTLQLQATYKKNSEMLNISVEGWQVWNCEAGGLETKEEIYERRERVMDGWMDELVGVRE